MTERDFQRCVLQIAKLFGWRTAHFRPARTAACTWHTPVEADGKGFPDLMLLRRDQMLVREIKVGSRKLSPEQTAWIEAYPGVWRDTDWDLIEDELR